MLVEFAIGEAYGLGFQHAPKSFANRCNDCLSYYTNPNGSNTNGSYDCMTQNACAMADVLVQNFNFDHTDIAEALVDRYHNNPCDGYSKHQRNVLNDSLCGEDLLTGYTSKDERSLAIPRGLVFGVLPNRDHIVTKSQSQATFTNQQAGVDSAVLAGLALHYVLYDLGPIRGLSKYLLDFMPKIRVPWCGQAAGKANVILSAAITSLCRNDVMSELLIDCVKFTGEVGTVAGVACAIASCSGEYENDLSDYFYTALSRGDELQRLDDKLMSLVRN